MKKLNVFMLAAGFGERLSPITDFIPKPLIPVLGKPLLERALEMVSSLPVKGIGINTHYKWKMLQDWINASSYSGKIKIFYEDPLLGTGGALKNAEHMLGESLFLVHNSDILSNIDLETLVEKHLSSGNIVTLAVHDYKKFKNVWIDRQGHLKYIGKSIPQINDGLHQVAFTGIAVYSPEFLNYLPGGNSSIVDAWLKAVSLGYRVGTADVTGCSWNDIGSPEDYSTAIFDLLAKDGEAIYVHPSVDCRRIEIDDYAVIEKDCVFEGSAEIKNCIILPGSKIKNNSCIENALVGPNYRISIKRSQIMLNDLRLSDPSSSLLSSFFDNFSGNTEMTLIGLGGSDRDYYRIRGKERSAVLMKCSKTDSDFSRQLAYTQFFRKYSVPVPELFGSNKDNLIGIFEDVGNITLYSWLKCRKDPERIELLFKRVLDILTAIHTTATNNITECPILQSRTFDYEYLRWETEYFMEQFISRVKNVDIKERNSIDKEFDNLARRVDSFKKTIVHRDFHSQNVLVTRGDIPRLVDYQGARMGPPAYDLVSILWDPYFRLENKMRFRLLDYYIEQMKNFFDNLFDESAFRQTFLPCRLQRHMQALGAYGYLANIKGKTYFLKYIPRALQYLNEETKSLQDEYPALHTLVKKLI